MFFAVFLPFFDIRHFNQRKQQRHQQTINSNQDKVLSAPCPFAARFNCILRQNTRQSASFISRQSQVIKLIFQLLTQTFHFCLISIFRHKQRLCTIAHAAFKELRYNHRIPSLHHHRRIFRAICHPHHRLAGFFSKINHTFIKPHTRPAWTIRNQRNNRSFVQFFHNFHSRTDSSPVRRPINRINLIFF